MTNKKELRDTYKKLRASLSEGDRDQMSMDIANQVLQLDIWKYDYYHIFLPIKRLREINTEYILSILSGKDKNILISASNFETMEMKQYLLTDNTKLLENTLGIPEPIDGIEIPNTATQVVFIPLLCYDTKGNRVGYGKGFYDRFLANCSPEVRKVGLSFFEPEKVTIQSNRQDVRLDYCITPKKSYKF